MLRHLFEHRGEALLPPCEFLLRLLRHGLMAVCLMGAALGIGVVGYHHFESLPWIDSLLDAAMILGGMGPVHPIQTTGGKLFASFYALFSGVVFITLAAILVAPVLHRLLHFLHLEFESADEERRADHSEEKNKP